MPGELTTLGRGVSLTRTGLRLPEGLSVEEWSRIGSQLARVVDASAWAIGDWCFYGQYAGYGQKYSEALEVTGLSYQTLKNYAWVAGRFERSRRRDRLSVAHHVEVASLREAEQEAWLDRAEQNGWTREQLREAIETDRGLPARREFPLRVTIEPSAEERERWVAAAAAAGVDVTEWIRDVLNAAAEEQVRELEAIA